uniref:(northern house mosquito) hypothetical protein n=1 Tax=Culex pipiens TaxID=7175 RepID=A0A8D8DPI7_CULPI
MTDKSTYRKPIIYCLNLSLEQTNFDNKGKKRKKRSDAGEARVISEVMCQKKATKFSNIAINPISPHKKMCQPLFYFLTNFKSFSNTLSLNHSLTCHDSKQILNKRQPYPLSCVFVKKNLAAKRQTHLE